MEAKMVFSKMRTLFTVFCTFQFLFPNVFKLIFMKHSKLFSKWWFMSWLLFRQGRWTFVHDT